MTERQLTVPTDLCLPGGQRLNPDARGWSSRPLIHPNLRGGWGRTKRWDYWAVLTRDHAIAITYADVDYLGIAALWWVDLTTGRTGGREITVPFARGIDLPDMPGTEPLRFRHHHLALDLTPTATGDDLHARWRERDGAVGHLEVSVARPTAHGSVDVVIPWSDTRFQFTSKHQARPATGTCTVDGRVRELGGADDPAWGVLDVGRGRWPYRTRWNWGGGAGTAVDGRTIGIQIGGMWTEGTGATENGIIVDGEVVKISDEVAWRYDWDDPMAPWDVRSPDGSLDIRLTPRFDRHARTEALVLGTEVHQVFGTWTGQVPTPGGAPVAVEGLVGFAEESRSRW